MNTHVVIMAGGIGSRLWPLSTPEMPKQFIDVLGVGKSLIQLTVDRFLPLCARERFWVVTSARYVETVRHQLPACWKISLRDPDANIVVTPADALVLKTDLFAETIRKALAFTQDSDAIVTVGIAPTRPETGYGYIHASQDLKGQVVRVAEFKEKPDRATAEAYLADGRYFWNAGIFVWRASTIVSELRTHAPQIAGVMDVMAPSFYTDREPAVLAEFFPTCEKISIDYAVMEKSCHIHVIAEDLGWSDLGSWGSVMGHLVPDADGNAVIGGDVRLHGCKDCFVHVAGEKTVVVEGLEGYIVAESAGRLLVCRLSEEQHIKEYSAS